MAPTGHETYINGHFTEDDDQSIHAPLGSSPPPAYDVAVAERAHRASSFHRLDQISPVLTTYPHGTQYQGRLSSVSPNSACGGYGIVVSGGMAEMAGGHGLVYHHLVQGSSPPPSHHSAPLSVQVSHDLSTLPSPNLNSPAQQLATSTAPPNLNSTWTPDQNRFILRLDKVEGKSLQEISIALEHVFHVERDTDAIARQLAYLRARGKAWNDGQLKQAIEKTTQQLNQVLLQEELSITGNLSGIPPDSTISSTGTSTARNDEQLADVELAVRLELDQMLRDSSVGADLEQRMFHEQKERNTESAAMITTDLCKDSIEDYEVV